MHSTCFLRCFLSTPRVLARRGHGGVAQVQKELERLAVLEHSMLQPATVRAQQPPAVAQAAAATYLREYPDRVARVRAATLDAEAGQPAPALGVGFATSGSSSSGVAQSADGSQVSNLTQFLSRCKQLKIQYSSDGEAAARRRGREALRSFWASHAASAVACCYQGVREVGFVAECGLADTGMHLDLPELWVVLRVLKAEAAVASSVDATRILQYLARELQYLERGHAVPSHRKDTPSTETARPTAANLLAFRQALTDLSLDLLAFFFVVHNPSVDALPQHIAGDGAPTLTEPYNSSSSSSSSTNPRAPSSSPPTSASPPPPYHNVAIASAIDALSGLEVLAVLSAQDATQETITKVWEQRQVSALRSQREPAVVAATAQTALFFPPDAAAAPSSAALAREVHYLLVAELFRFAAVQRRDLRMTDVVHGFALMRIHLQTLWPPYARHRQQSPSTTTASAKTVSRSSGAAPAATAALSQASSPPPPPIPPAPPRPLWYEKDSLFRITWGFAIALLSKDRRLISSYHYVKIVTTLAKLPGFVLAPAPEPKKELRRLKLSDESRPSGPLSGQESSEDPHDAQLSLLSEIPPEQRRLMQMTEEEPSSLPHSNDAASDVVLHPADFWRFIVSKACVFVPGLPSEQRRVVCRSLHIAITEKRGHLLRGSAVKRSRAMPPVPVRLHRRGIASKFNRAAASMAAGGVDGNDADDAADIILPLVEEMATYDENYDACIQDRHRPPPQHYQRQSTSKPQKRRNKW